MNETYGQLQLELVVVLSASLPAVFVNIVAQYGRDIRLVLFGGYNDIVSIGFDVIYRLIRAENASACGTIRNVDSTVSNDDKNNTANGVTWQQHIGYVAPNTTRPLLRSSHIPVAVDDERRRILFTSYIDAKLTALCYLSIDDVFSTPTNAKSTALRQLSCLDNPRIFSSQIRLTSKYSNEYLVVGGIFHIEIADGKLVREIEPVLEYYNINDDKWSNDGTLLSSDRLCGTFVVDTSTDLAYLFGGQTLGHEILTTVESYNPDLREWKKEPMLAIPRTRLVGVYIPRMKGFLIAGGQWHIGRETRRSMEFYSITNHTSTLLSATLPEGITSDDGSLHLIDGHLLIVVINGADSKHPAYVADLSSCFETGSIISMHLQWHPLPQLPISSFSSHGLGSLVVSV